MKKVCRFQFANGINAAAVEHEIALAIRVAECMYGRARVRLEAGYLPSKDGRVLVVDCSSEVGRYLARLITGFLIRSLGERSFDVEQLDRSAGVGARYEKRI